ncbi:hypothetical protein PQX77_008097 [Marasmius sp. AFHP31]|nr:hypothetical protein PQX77_008097 [Marasmius sp. AFHP31]
MGVHLAPFVMKLIEEEAVPSTLASDGFKLSANTLGLSIPSDIYAQKLYSPRGDLSLKDPLEGFKEFLK